MKKLFTLGLVALLAGQVLAVPLGHGLGDWFTGNVSVAGTIEVGTISEKVSAAGIAVDGLKIKDGGMVTSGFRASSSVAQTISTGSFTTIVYGTETYDTLADYNNTTGIFKAPTAGIYLICGSARSASVAWAEGNVWHVAVFVAETRIANGSREPVSYAITASLSSIVSICMALAANDEVTLRVYQSRGSDTDTINQATGNYFMVQKIS